MTRMYLFILAVLGFLAFSTGQASAATTTPHSLTHADLAMGVSIGVGLIAAHAGSLLVKYRAPQYVKAAVTFVLSTLVGVTATAVWADGASWTVYLRDIFYALGAQVFSHYTGVTNLIAAKTMDFGLTASRPDPLDTSEISAEAPDADAGLAHRHAVR